MERKQKFMGNKGFSLVELIVVIAIMAVLVGVLAPQFIKYVEKSRESTDVQNMQECMTAVETYCTDNALTDKITITLTSSAVATDSTYDSTKKTGALANAGIADTKLKSARWGTVELIYDAGANTWSATYSDGSKLVITPTDSFSFMKQKTA